MYTFWAGVIITNFVVLVGAIKIGGGLGDNPWDFLLFTPALVALGIGVPPWVMSRKALLRRSLVEKEISSSGVSILSERIFILPFAYTSANILLVPFMLFVLLGVGWILSLYF